LSGPESGVRRHAGRAHHRDRHGAWHLQGTLPLREIGARAIARVPRSTSCWRSAVPRLRATRMTRRSGPRDPGGPDDSPNPRYSGLDLVMESLTEGADP